MKQIVYGIAIGMIILLGISAVVTISSKQTRKSDMDNALSISVENAVETTMRKKTYTIADNEEFIADFTENLLVQISNDSDIKIKIAKVDYEKGIMAVNVTEHFTHPNGKEGKNECLTTVVFEHVPIETELKTITYLDDDGSLIKEYQITKGDDIIVPQNPTKEGKTFKGWKDAKGNMITITGKVTADVSYTAVWQ